MPLDYEALQERAGKRLREMMGKYKRELREDLQDSTREAKETIKTSFVHKPPTEKTAEESLQEYMACPKCGSSEIVVIAWVDANTRVWWKDCPIEAGHGYKCRKGCGGFVKPIIAGVAS